MFMTPLDAEYSWARTRTQNRLQKAPVAAVQPMVAEKGSAVKIKHLAKTAKTSHALCRHGVEIGGGRAEWQARVLPQPQLEARVGVR